jgi:hypothetical protein
MSGACSTCGDNRNIYRGLVGKTERKSPLGRPNNRWEDNIKINLKHILRARGQNQSRFRIGTNGGLL